MSLITRKLSHQIITLCVGLVLVTSISVMASFWWFSSRYTADHINTTVNSAIHVFEQYSRTEAELLKTAAQVLTADFGFKQAVATGDAATIASALENHGSRINAALMLLSDRDGKVFSSNQPQFVNENTDRLVRSLVLSPGETFFVEHNKRVYQVIVLPVKAPLTIAYAIVGFEITQAVTRELKQLTGLDISFFNHNALLVSSLSNEASNLQRILQRRERGWFIWQRPQYANTSREISAVGRQQLTVLLSDNLNSIYQNFDRLVVTTIVIALAIVVLGLIASVLLANSLTVPLARLVQGVHRFARGEYETKIVVSQASSEIQTLVNAFGNMGDEIRNRERHILYQAQHDLLTGLVNRDTLLHAIDNATQKQPPFYLVATHIRDLQGINDNLGFDVGDTCIKEIVRRLKTCFKQHAAIHGRLEGDLFLSLISYEEAIPPNDTLLASVIDALQKPIAVHALNLNVRFNLGISFFPQDGDTGKTLVRRALIALESARKENCSFRLYRVGEDEAHLERLAIVEDLKLALQKDDGQLSMHYQPKQNIRSGEIEKLEALIRWQRPATGFVPPDLFIDLAERAGLIVELTQWVFNTVLSQLASWHRQGINIQVAINISAQDLNHPEFLGGLEKFVQRHRVEPRFITLELTERDLMSDETQGISLMQTLRDSGYTLSVDDYGIGQSSLGKLKQLPIHELKIDKSFILKLDQSPTDQMIVRSTIDLGHNLGLSVVAEGVENQASLQLLRDMGCDYIQGYYLAKPLSAADVSHWLLEYERVLEQA